MRLRSMRSRLRRRETLQAVSKCYILKVIPGTFGAHDVLGERGLERNDWKIFCAHGDCAITQWPIALMRT